MSTQKTELVNVQTAVMRYLGYQSQSIQDLWQLINARFPHGDITPQAFQQSIGDLLNRGRVILSGGQLATQ